MRSNCFKKGFTLAEIMIVLTVIGVLTAVLLPSAFHATPDENIMKFKKANATLSNIIRELVSSDKYYATGDLGKLRNGNLVQNTTYFCEAFADIVSTKGVNCWGGGTAKQYADIRNNGKTDKTKNIPKFKTALDTTCKTIQKSVNAGKDYQGAEIVTTDNVVWFEASPATPMGICNSGSGASCVRLFSDPESGTAVPADFQDSQGFDAIYKVFCMDVDGGNGSDSDKSEAPFGYGIRADGKIMPGARADEWAKRSVQDKD
ncbi:MAG: type II secretion system protein [Candidatus Gastranaerophilales bacterium]|nr:type II secretion system protein [Candidatus Gastranaerophilales bacterium]